MPPPSPRSSSKSTSKKLVRAALSHCSCCKIPEKEKKRTKKKDPECNQCVTNLITALNKLFKQKKEPERSRKWWALIPSIKIDELGKQVWVKEQVSHLFVRDLNDDCIAKLKTKIGETFEPKNPDERSYLVVFLKIRYGKAALQEYLGFVQANPIRVNWNWLAATLDPSQDNYGFPKDGKIPEIYKQSSKKEKEQALPLIPHYVENNYPLEFHAQNQIMRDCFQTTDCKSYEMSQLINIKRPMDYLYPEVHEVCKKFQRNPFYTNFDASLPQSTEYGNLMIGQIPFFGQNPFNWINHNLTEGNQSFPDDILSCKENPVDLTKVEPYCF